MQFIGQVLTWLWKSSGDILTNLIAAAIGGLVVWLHTEGRRKLSRHRTRKFWRGMAAGRLTAVVGDHDRVQNDGWEPSGLVGLEDVWALMAIQEQLREIGVPLTLRDDNNFVRDDWNVNLILIGGPDVNRVAAGIVGAIESALPIIFPGWRDHAVDLYDKVDGKPLYPKSDGGKVVRDYGIVTRFKNPLGRNGSEVIHIAGCWGYGTRGAAEALNRNELLKHPIVRSGAPFQALVEILVIEDTPHFSRLMSVRRILQETPQAQVPRTQ